MEQTLSSMVHENLKIDIVKITIAKIEISSPFKGRVVKLAANPKNAARPKPHAAHPGANMPRNIPIPPKILVLEEILFLKFTLYITKLNKTPVRKLKTTMLIKLESRILPLKLTKREKIKGIVFTKLNSL